MILVTGATGTIGSEVVRVLAERGEQVRAMTRDPEAAVLPPDLRAHVRLVRGDFDDRASLGAATAGAEAVFLLSAPGAGLARHDRAALDAVREHGVARVVKLSAIGTGEDTGLRGNTWHLPGEQGLPASGAAWTVLRPTAFASNTLSWAADIRAGRPVANLTGSGAQGVVDPRDIAEVAAAALTAPGHHGRTYTLTGPELLSTPDQVEILAQVLGRPVGVVDVPEDAAKEQMIAAGYDAELAESALGGLRFIAEGRNARLTGDVEAVLGRPPRRYADWARAHKAAFDG
ncbi:NAD(P)H-binding protein [Actinacidiphila epipremni]|uniref:NAD(P)H-binding protein n=1 Tax=Actinacidiphila epipremni TaxID=2053013 RepID=A0ABX0ZIQ1_9ACTN|nr:NAD(P)H-binding protein [Actinacidiphila epipremni]NJP43645.1 NAD(P)H-binding protein [Actinacidiphila epipremni]